MAEKRKVQTYRLIAWQVDEDGAKSIVDIRELTDDGSVTERTFHQHVGWHVRIMCDIERVSYVQVEGREPE